VEEYAAHFENVLVKPEYVITVLDSLELLAIDQHWLDLLWDEEMLALPDLTYTVRKPTLSQN